MRRYGQMILEIKESFPKVRELLRDNFTLSHIYENLKENSEISCSKSMFYKVVKRFLHLPNAPKSTLKLEIAKSKSKNSRLTSKICQEEEIPTIKKFHYDPTEVIPDDEL